MLDGQQVHEDTALLVCTSPQVAPDAARFGFTASIENAGGKVLVEKDGPVTIVTINRPRVKNACDVETVQALHDAFRARCL